MVSRLFPVGNVYMYVYICIDNKSGHKIQIANTYLVRIKPSISGKVMITMIHV